MLKDLLEKIHLEFLLYFIGIMVLYHSFIEIICQFFTENGNIDAYIAVYTTILLIILFIIYARRNFYKKSIFYTLLLYLSFATFYASVFDSEQPGNSTILQAVINYHAESKGAQEQILDSLDQVKSGITDNRIGIQNLDSGIAVLRQLIMDQAEKNLENKSSKSEALFIEWSPDEEIIQGNIVQEFVALGDPTELRYLNHNKFVRGTSVDAVRNSRSNSFEGLQNRTAIIMEGVFGTLYAFPNGDFFYFRHTTTANIFIETFELKVITEPDDQLSIKLIITDSTADKLIPNRLCSDSGKLIGTSGPDGLWAGCGQTLTQSEIIGLDGSDLVSGSRNADKIKGGKGNNLIFVNGGDDEVDAGEGSNIIVIPTRNYTDKEEVALRIVEFECTNDMIDLRHVIDHNVYAVNSGLDYMLTFAFIKQISASQHALMVDPDGRSDAYEPKQVAIIQSNQPISSEQGHSKGCFELI